MAETAETTASTATEGTEAPTTETPETETVDWKAEAEKWKANSRKNEENAKANAAAAKRLKELEDANKTEQEKLNDALNEARTEAAGYQAELARFQAAVRHGLAEEHLDLLGNGTPDEIDARASKLAELAAASTTATASRPVNGLGRTETPAALNGDPLLQSLKSKLGI